MDSPSYIGMLLIKIKFDVVSVAPRAAEHHNLPHPQLPQPQQHSQWSSEVSCRVPLLPITSNHRDRQKPKWLQGRPNRLSEAIACLLAEFACVRKALRLAGHWRISSPHLPLCPTERTRSFLPTYSSGGESRRVYA